MVEKKSKMKKPVKYLVGPDGKKIKIIKRFKIGFDPKKIFLWALILFLFLPGLWVNLKEAFFEAGKVKKLSFSQAVEDIRAGKVEKVTVREQELTLDYKDETTGLSRKESEESLSEVLDREGIESGEIEIEVKMISNRWLDFGLQLLFYLGLGLFMLWTLRRAQGGANSLFGFGKSKAKLFDKGKQKMSFKDVGGMTEAKKELEEIVDFLKNPKKYEKLGARTPKGVLMLGPSGTGKTLLAKAVAGEAGVTFFSMAGSEFMEMLVGVGASRVRDLFSTAKKSAPAIIFIDELDAIGQTRGNAISGGHGEREQTLNQILVEMDGFEPNEQLVVIAASNRPDVLDPALVRPGRFDRRVILSLPDLNERREILKIHSRGKPFVSGFSWVMIAKQTVGFSGADLENMLNEAAIMAARDNRKTITLEDVNEAAMKVKMGPEKKRLQSKYERKMTAYHEAGHALVAHFLPHTDPVRRVSIVSRGMALGFTQMTPERDKYSQTESELVEKTAVMLGGRAAEELIFKELTAGAANDIKRATIIARKMVIELGMSELGPIDFGPQWGETEWGMRYFEPTRVGEKMQGKVDIEVKKLLDSAYEQAKKILKEKKVLLEKVGEKLLEVETLDGEEFKKIVGRKNE
jgi:cell division protease FtsH